VLTLVHEHRRYFLGTALAGLALRLLFVVYFPAVTDDSHIYADLATNWLQHGIYGLTESGQQAESEKHYIPTDSRLPGYPAFLALIFWLFGIGNLKAVMLAQCLFDLGTCLIISDLARRLISARAASIAFALAALCPFLANYAATVLTETLEIFFTALALDFTAAALDHMCAGGQTSSPAVRDRKFFMLWAMAGAAIAACILLRPDGGLVLATVMFYVGILSWKSVASKSPDASRRVGGFAIAAVVLVLVANAPLVPWTIRNFRTFHHFQPLAPRYANDTDELVLRGFNRWVKTWMADYASVEEIYWNVPGEKIDPQKLPARAIENEAERNTTLALIADYNDNRDITADLDARFDALAADRIRNHPLRYYVILPLVRVADIWLRPRTETLPPDVRWWEFNDDANRSAAAVGFGVLNLAYVVAALLALIRRRPAIRWAGLLLTFLILRSALLATLENPEPRYSLECYPAVIVLAASFLAGTQNTKSSASASVVPKFMSLSSL
jgi:4-amino-4-deoxy-L-arabinose transferase-like glycosyltransferase